LPVTEKPAGEPPFPQLRYCVRCCLPDTVEGIQFDEMGICLACRSQEQKMRIDWAAREKKLRALLAEAKAKAGDNYDCIVPISGGKDSAFQLHVLVKVYGLTPLAVTFSHNWFTETGKYNLWNILERLEVDHMMYTPNRGLVNKLARQSLPLIGDACWHCHAGVYSYPFHVATRFKIPLMIYGESYAEASARTTYLDEAEIEHKDMVDYAWKNTAAGSADRMLSDQVSRKEMNLFFPPSREEMRAAGIYAIHLGDYLYWDNERTTEFLVKEYGWREDKVEGSYKHYKSVECRMAGVHDYAKFIKRGFGRGTDFASQDVRAGLMTREEGFDVAAKVDAERPPTLDYYLEQTGRTEAEFNEILRAMRKDKAKLLP
jgi:N-acetyl sugar amidotransferase